MNTKKKVICVSAGILSIVAAVATYTLPIKTASAEETNFTVNIAESLAVSLTTPIDDTANNTGDPGDFLRNSVELSVFSNTSTGSAAGYTATMYEEGSSTNLVHTNNDYLKTINGNVDVTVPTLSSSSVRSSFPAGRWGYSLEGTYTGDAGTYNETIAGNDNSNYYAMTNSSSPITVLKSTTAGSGTRNIFFGAKASPSNPSGTYAGTVIINVVTGIIDEATNPTVPTNPAIDQPTTPSNPIAYNYDSTNNRTVYTSVSTTTGTAPNPDTETTTTIISSGDTTATYSNPLGETERTMASVSTGSPLALGLAAAAGVAATSGIIFFILAKRRDDDDEEEEEL